MINYSKSITIKRQPDWLSKKRYCSLYLAAGQIYETLCEDQTHYSVVIEWLKDKYRASIEEFTHYWLTCMIFFAKHSTFYAMPTIYFGYYD